MVDFDVKGVCGEKLREAIPAIAARISSLFKSRIETGVNPLLKNATIARKRALGYSQPDTPLLATGEMAGSLVLGEIRDTPEGIEFDMVSNARVDPNWHVNEGHQAQGVPVRNPFEGQEEAIGVMIQEALG